MSNILNKSNHPVEVKKIDINVWTLRDEIESAISMRLKEHPDTPSNEVDISDIKDFYNKIYSIDGNNDEDNLDTSSNPMDDDGDDASEDKESTEEAGDKPEDKSSDQEDAETKDTDESSGESTEEGESYGDDDAAAEMADAMLADQGAAPETAPDNEASLEKYQRAKPPEEKRLKGFIFLSDVNMQEIMFFAKSDFLHGQSIVVEFCLPSNFSQTASVLKSSHITRNSKVISPNKPTHRIHATFQFRFEEERTRLRNFLKSIEPVIPTSPKKLKKPSDGEDNDDDFDDLGF